jgi:hypothetical protein
MKLKKIKKIHQKPIAEIFFFKKKVRLGVRTRAVQRIRAFKKATTTELFSLNGTVNTKFDYFCYQYCNNQSFSLSFFYSF